MSAAGDTAGGIPAVPGLRRAAARARSARDGVASVEAFSRGDAIDRDWMGWGALRVLSHQDWAPGALREGRVANMERLLLVLQGRLDADCGGCGHHRVEEGEVLWIGTGHGLASRLANADEAAPLRLVELWLQPDRVNAPPAAARWAPAGEAHPPGTTQALGGWRLLAQGGAGPLSTVDVAPGPGLRVPEAGVPSAMASREPVLRLRQAARVLLAHPRPGACLALPESGGGRRWLEVIAGEVLATQAAPSGGPSPGSPLHLGPGDGLGWLATGSGRPLSLTVAGDTPAHLLLLDLPA